MALTKAQVKAEYRQAFLAIVASVLDDTNFDTSMEAMADAFVDSLTADYGFTTKVITSNYTANYREFLLVDATSGEITITLPAPVADEELQIKKTDWSTNEIAIVGGNIDRKSDLRLKYVYTSLTLHCDGTNWWIK